MPLETRPGVSWLVSQSVTQFDHSLETLPEIIWLVVGRSVCTLMTDTHLKQPEASLLADQSLHQPDHSLEARRAVTWFSYSISQSV